MTVLVRDDRIEAVAPTGDVAIPEGARVIDATGHTLIPGLWDAHVHFDYEPDISPGMFALFLANGITSVRDTGGLIDHVMPWKRRAESGTVAAPRVFVAGPLIDGVPRVYDGGDPFRPELAVEVGSPEAARRIVEELATSGVDLVKAYEMLSPETFAAVVEAAAERGLPVTGHPPLSMDGVEAAVALDSVEHLRNLEMTCSSMMLELLQQRRDMLAAGAGGIGGDLRSAIHAAQRPVAFGSQDRVRCGEVMARIAAAGTRLVPTLTITTARSIRRHERPDWIETFDYLPEPARRRWREGAATLAGAETSAVAIGHSEWAMKFVADAVAAGIPIMAGTDTPIYFLTPGFSLHEELELLARSGMTPMQVLAAATLEPASFFGLQDRMGSIAPGMAADVVLLRQSPLLDVRNTRDIEAVMSRGHLYDRVALDAMLAGLSAPAATEISMPPRPAWCDDLPRPAYASLERVMVASDWFEVYAVRPGVYAIYEPHQWQEVISYLILGEERALLWDSGMGIADIAAVVRQLTDLPVTVANSHTHYDHVGGNARFDDVLGFDLDYTRVNAGGAPNEAVRPEVAPAALCRDLPVDVSASAYRIEPFAVSRTIANGQIIDLGGRQLEVVAVPGHTPDAAALLDRDAGLLFTGDTFYEGPIYLFAPETDMAAYQASVDRLAALVPQLQLLLPGHNTPTSAPEMLVRLRAAVTAIAEGSARPEVHDGRASYTFEGFSVLVREPR